MTFAPDVESAIENAARQIGVDVNTLRAIARIESSGNPNARTGSYQGLYQLSPTEFAKYSDGNIYDAADNALAGAARLRDQSAEFAKQYGRQPTPGELYLIHQQGAGGAAAHWAKPDAAAWENMAGTAEGRQKGADWAKRAIWGNIPDDMKGRFGSVENVTSKDFANLWNMKVSGTQYASRDQLPKQADTTGRINTVGPNGGINSEPAIDPALAPYLTAENSPAASPTAQPAQKPGEVSSPAGVLRSVLARVAPNTNAALAPKAGQQTQDGNFGSLTALIQPSNSAGAGGQLDPSTQMRLQTVAQNNAAAANTTLDPVAPRQPIDLSRLRAVLAARRGLA